MFKKLLRNLQQSFRLMVGVPDYESYVRHRQEKHPGQKIMSYEEFFRERQERRYRGAGSGRCC